MKIIERIKSRLKKKKELDAQVEKKELDKDLVASLASDSSKKGMPSLKQLKYLPRVLSEKHKRIIGVLFLAIVAGIIFLGVRLYLWQTEVVPQVGGEYVEGLVGSPVYINPLFALANDVDSDISKLIFSGLFKYNEKQELTPDLVSNYAVSEDEKTYTFYLKRNIKWHDGRELTAEDVVFTFKAVQDMDFRSPLEPSLRGAEVNKIDDYTLNVTLQESFSPFLSGLTFGILPSHLWFDIPAANSRLAELNLKPIGSGPYKFKALTKNKSGSVISYELERNDAYYDRPAYIESVKFIFYADVVSLVEAAKNKRVTGVAFAPLSLKSELKRNKELKYYNLRLPQYTAVFLNQKSDILADKSVKQALAWGFDRNRIVEGVLEGEGEVIYSPILPGYLGFNAEVEKYGFDQEKARKILDDAGWVFLEGDTVRHKGGKELAFTITTVDQPEYVKTAKILKEEWEALNIRVELSVIAAEEMQATIIKPRNYEALIFGEIIGTDPDPYPFWHSSQAKHPGLNLAAFANKKVDQLLEEARKTSDPEQRLMKYLNFQNILAEELPAIFLYNPVYAYSVNKSVKGLKEQYIVVPSDRLSGLVNWYIKTKRIKK